VKSESVSSRRHRPRRARLALVRTALAASIGVGFGACVDRALDVPRHELLTKEEVCEIYCDMELNCPNFPLGFSSDCFEHCMDPRIIYPEMNDECAEFHFARYACWVDIGCENLPDPSASGEQREELCTSEDIDPAFVYTPEKCGQTLPDADGG
jgi:hypothetical protein